MTRKTTVYTFFRVYTLRYAWTQISTEIFCSILVLHKPSFPALELQAERVMVQMNPQVSECVLLPVCGCVCVVGLTKKNCFLKARGYIIQCYVFLNDG